LVPQIADDVVNGEGREVFGPRPKASAGPTGKPLGLVYKAREIHEQTGKWRPGSGLFGVILGVVIF
jgi:hypothetical protein